MEVKKISETIEYNPEVVICGRMKSNVEVWTIKRAINAIYNNLIVLLPDFLQRKLLELIWLSDDSKNSKEYIYSVWKGTHVFDPFSIVLIDKIISMVQLKINVSTGKELNEYKKILDILNDHLIPGQDVYVCLDGQSRLILGIMSYVSETGGYPLDKENTNVLLTIDGKESNILSEQPFRSLPEYVKDKFYEIELQFNVVDDFHKLDDIIEALVNKQKGNKWSRFQIDKQSNRFQPFVIKLLEKSEDKKYSDGYENCMSNTTSSDLRFDRDGDQLMLLCLAYLYHYGKWPSHEEISKLLSNPKFDITDTAFDNVKKYVNEYFIFASAPKAKKIETTKLVNYVILRQLMDNVKSKTSSLFQSISFGKQYTIKNNIEFINQFIQWDIKLSDIKHEASGIFDAKTKEYLKLTDGYKSLSGGQGNKQPEDRMKLFVKYFPFEELEKNGIIVSDTKMPSMEQVLLHNDFKDVNGNKVSMREVKNNERGHLDSRHNGGTNHLDNLVPELMGDNRSHRESNIKKK
jgi:hypothetical protein